MSDGSASHEPLASRLRRASTNRLLELVTVHARELGVREVRQILLNPYVTAAIIDELLCHRKLLASYEVRSAVARHRRTPQTAAMRFISGLYWNDLLAIATDMRLAPAVRRLAEKYLLLRLDRLTAGEKITIAHRATPAVIEKLRRDRDRRVFQALLENPRLSEAALLPVASDDGTPPRILDLIARHLRWGPRYAIRVALSRNPRTPFRAIFELLPALRRQDLSAVVELEAHSSVVRHRAREILDAGLERRGSPPSGPDDDRIEIAPPKSSDLGVQ